MAGINLPIRNIIIWGISLALCLSAGGTVVNLMKRREVVRERERELVRLEEENRTLERTLSESKEDAYVERIARDKLGMVREGETIVIVPGEAGISGKGSASDDMPTWKKWWGLFF